ncbi:MAG: zinc ribbon domain-containing protein [Candidatus Hermodarchaeota archaeon]
MNSLSRELNIRHSFSMHPYGTSMGETYEMIFGYNPEKSITYVSVGIKFSWFGRGFTWLVPQEMMEKWAKEMGIRPIKLMKKQNPKYLEIFNDKTNVSNQLTPNQTKMFCAYCGSENSLASKFCSKCGMNLEST